MKFPFFLVSFLFPILVSQNPKQGCGDCKFYDISLMEINIPKDRPLMVSFDFELSNSLKTSLLEHGFFNQREAKLIESALEKSDDFICKSTKQKLVELKTINNPGDNERYSKLNYGTPVHVNNEKVYLFFERLEIKKGRGVAGGAALMAVFTKEHEVWSLKETKMLEQY